jgi:putative redox protein
MPSAKIEFPGATGATLAARLDSPDGPPRAYALFAHCYTCGKDLLAAKRIAQTLANDGIAVLRFDFTGLGHSEGEFANTDFSSNVGDLVAAADYLRAHHAAPQLVIGHSLGGAAVLAAAGDIPEVRAIATIGAPSDPAHVAHHFDTARQTIEAEGEAVVELAGRAFRVRREFLEDLADQKLLDRVRGLRCALLVLHSPVDNIVGIDNASAIFVAARHPKSFVSLDDADHLLSQARDAEYAAAVIGTWARRYVDAADGAIGAPTGLPAAGEVVVAESGENPFAQTIRVGRHSLRADEPPQVGGGDTGPTPYDLLSAALGACTAMTLRMYANRKKLPLERVIVRLSHDKVHADDCDGCEDAAAKIDRIERRIELIGDLDAATRQRLLEIADRCPVHQTLERANRIETRLVTAST